MTPEQIEPFAIRLALGNNGGTWDEHYTEKQKEHWRQFVRDVAKEITAVERANSIAEHLRGEME